MTMMKSALSLFALFAIAAPAAAQTVESTNRTRWERLPTVKMKSVELDVDSLSGLTERILASGECQVPGMRADRFDIDQPYAVLVAPSGTVERIVIGETGCPQINSLLGTTIHHWAELGKYRPTGQSEARWYAGRIAYARN
jgi:hypothetical protein